MNKFKNIGKKMLAMLLLSVTTISSLGINSISYAKELNNNPQEINISNEDESNYIEEINSLIVIENNNLTIKDDKLLVESIDKNFD